MKKVVSGNDLREKMIEAIDLLVDNVKITLGPIGKNVIINHSSFSPFITNDGVTIASNIESEDEVINTILTIAKEASIKTNELVGDGTTTTLVLLGAIYKLGIDLINSGIKPILLKEELDNSVDKIIKLIKKKSRPVTNQDIYNIALISSNSKEIGSIISDAYNKVKDINSIKIKESNENTTKLIYKIGYSIDTNLASPYFLTDKNLSINDAYVILTNLHLYDIENISNIINNLNDKNIIIFADDYSEEFINNVVSMYLNKELNIILFKNTEYGINKLETLKDLEAITNANIIYSLDNINLNNIGNINKIEIDEDLTTIINNKNELVSKRINELEKYKSNNSFDKDFINRRISMLKNGLVEISVGAKTDTERRELKMRYDDALCAISSLSDGVVVGSGLVFYEISNMLDEKNNGNKLLKEALKYPLKQILINAGLNDEDIINKIKKIIVLFIM